MFTWKPFLLPPFSPSGAYANYWAQANILIALKVD